MQDRNFVIAFEDSPSADHSKRLQFDGAKGTHARRTEKAIPLDSPLGISLCHGDGQVSKRPSITPIAWNPSITAHAMSPPLAG